MNMNKTWKTKWKKQSQSYHKNKNKRRFLIHKQFKKETFCCHISFQKSSWIEKKLLTCESNRTKQKISHKNFWWEEKDRYEQTNESNQIIASHLFHSLYFYWKEWTKVNKLWCFVSKNLRKQNNRAINKRKKENAFAFVFIFFLFKHFLFWLN